MTSSPPAGLRERKKARTRAAIRSHAMRLFDEQGYAATTIDQIAEAADVSPSTLFRYFPTKEDLVLSDDYDPPLIAALRAQPATMHPIEAVRRSLKTVYESLTDEEWAHERRRQLLLDSVPELRARATQQFTQSIGLLGSVVAERAGLPAGDFSARVLAGAVVGAALAAVPDNSERRKYFDDFERALILLRDGLPLGPAGRPVSAQLGADRGEDPV